MTTETAPSPHTPPLSAHSTYPSAPRARLALDAARNHLEAARAAAGDLREEYDRGPTPGQSARVAAHHNAIRFGLKAAQVEAAIAGVEAALATSAAATEATVVLLDAGTLHHPACQARGEFSGLECSHGCDTRNALATRARDSRQGLAERIAAAKQHTA